MIDRARTNADLNDFTVEIEAGAEGWLQVRAVDRESGAKG